MKDNIEIRLNINGKEYGAKYPLGDDEKENLKLLVDLFDSFKVTAKEKGLI